MFMTIQSNVKDKILATPSETSKVENAPAEMLRDLDQQMEKRADDGKANVVTDALSRKERVKPRRVRAMAMTIQYGVRGMILAAQSEAFKQENALAERLHGLDQQMERKEDERADKTYYNLGDMYWSPVLWVEIGESSLTGLKLVQETTNKIRVDKTLRFVEEPIENSDREVKRLKCSIMVVVKFLFDELRYRIVNGVVTQLKVLTSLLDDGQGSGSWMFLFVWSGYAAMRALLWAGKVVSCKISCES
ncbi:hypothetical protein Tco_1457899 [Tanacetum coccineum]